MGNSSTVHWPKTSVRDELVAHLDAPGFTRNRVESIQDELQRLRENHPTEYALASAHLIAQINAKEERPRYALT